MIYFLRYYSIIAPKVIRADSEYHVAVSTTGVSIPSTIYIELNGLLDNGEIFNVSQVIRVQPYMTRILQFEVNIFKFFITFLYFTFNIYLLDFFFNLDW